MPTKADTCRTYIVPKLHAAGWDDDCIAEQRVIAPGRIVPTGQGHLRQNKRRPDYILFLRKDYPIAVVEAKAEYHRPGDGLQQAMNCVQMTPLPLRAEQRCIVAYLDGLQAKVDAVKQLQAQMQAELDALLPSVLDKAFKGEL